MDSGSVKKKETTSSNGLKTIFGSMMMVLLTLVFLGYALILMMMPTNTFYMQWMPALIARTNSTYFGSQGASILIYIFPILFIAAVGCLLLHMRSKSVDHNNKSGAKRLSSWKRPELVKGPLGIVSRMELAFLGMFIALLVWSLTSWLHNMFARSALQAAATHEHVWQAKLESTSLTLGLLGNMILAFLFFPVARGSSILQLVGLTSEASIKYHIWLGHLVMTVFTAHGLGYIIYWASTSQISQMLLWQKIGISNVPGEVSLLAGLAMWATSFPPIRRKMFELFFYTHHLYIVFVVFYVFHVGFATACIMLPGFYLFAIDRFLRFLQSQQKVSLVEARVLPCETVELSFSKHPGLSYSPTSLLFLNVPGISKLQWHPFTITSSSKMDPNKVSVVIKIEGSWSRTLYQKFASSTGPVNHLEVSVEGPYGPTSYNFARHEKLVLVSGGSGITPLISIIRELLSEAKDSGRMTPKVLLISAFKNSPDLAMLDLILPSSGTTLDIASLKLQIEVYVTREKEPTTDNHKPLLTLSFKPDPSDSPISAVLGRNSWLWLGAIISMSFVIFLVLLGLLTRFYIYPIEHSPAMMYNASYRAALYLLLLCGSIVITATAVFLWNKRRNLEETGQIKSVDSPPKLSTSPSAPLEDVELESLPHRSFIDSTNVHYGTRPNLQKILSECEGSSVGVIVSGPRKMRQEVAAICSSSSAQNLDYQSMSFSW